jgi:hypothetical protein
MGTIKETPKFYDEKSDELKSKMEILLSRYRKSYPLYKSSPNINEYKSMYQNDINQIQIIFDELFLLQSNISKITEDRSSKLQDINNDIASEKYAQDLGEKELNDNLNSAQSGTPRFKEFRQGLNTQYYILIYNILLLSGSIYILNKMLHIN